MYRSGEYTGPGAAAPDVAGMAPEYAHDAQPPYPGPSNAALEAIVRALREEVNVLKNVISASFDLQLDIQRSIRQEVSAAMNSPARLSLARPAVQETSTCTAEPEADMEQEGATSMVGKERTARPVAAGVCTVCLEARIDSLLYGCGHMCTCSMCGRQLIASGQSCPICRAPVRDVVRAFMVTE